MRPSIPKAVLLASSIALCLSCHADAPLKAVRPGAALHDALLAAEVAEAGRGMWSAYFQADCLGAESSLIWMVRRSGRSDERGYLIYDGRESRTFKDRSAWASAVRETLAAHPCARAHVHYGRSGFYLGVDGLGRVDSISELVPFT